MESGPGDLARPFLHALQERGGQYLGDVIALEELLQRITASAAEAWPGVSVETARFMSHLAHRVGPAAAGACDLERARTDDLYLALACALGDTAALATLEARVLPGVDPALARLRISPEMVDEVKQMVRTEVLVSLGPGRGPGIERYSGRGRLASWLRIIAVRAAGRLMDRGRREVLLTESVLGDLTPPSEDPEVEYLKDTYRAQFRAAFALALTDIPAEQRDLLCQHYLERLTIDDLGEAMGVHRATAARRVARAREVLLAATRRNLMSQVRVGGTECDSILRLIESQLQVSMPIRAGEPANS